MCEILAPAGDKNSAFAAINSGADAIYLGLRQFSARSSAENFGADELKEIVDYAAIFGVKVYVALNTMIKQEELDLFFKAAGAAYSAGADALIVQDMFLGRELKQVFPDLSLHLSTQSGVCNTYGARLAAKYGFSRVVLARETPLEEIAKISQIIQTEAFIQGALCTCFSGQCYLSSFAGGNSGNRGRCKQPCRKKYSIDRSGWELPAYRLSPSDLSIGEDIFSLQRAGVTSFKIEGRMRRPEYVAAAVGHYKSILGGGEGDVSALRRTYNRGNYTRGLAFGQDGGFLSPSVQGHIGEFVGTVKVVGGKFLCLSSYRFTRGDGFKILRGGTEVGGAGYDGETRGGFYVSSSARLKNGDKVFVTTDTSLNAALLSKKRLLPVRVEAEFKEGQVPRVNIDGFTFEGNEPLTTAVSRPLVNEDIRACFSKVGQLPFEVAFGAITVAGAPYLGMAKLNAFRREAYASYLSHITFKGERKRGAATAPPQSVLAKNSKSAVICTDLRGVRADIGILKPADYSADMRSLTEGFSGEKFLFVPPFATDGDIKIIVRAALTFDGIYCDGTYGIELARELGKPLFAGTGFNISNTFALTGVGAKYVCISKELTMREAQPLCAENAFYLTYGNIKVMDLAYCPFSRSCSSCERRERYILTDEHGRKFPLRRYTLSSCRFELYNCANLVCSGVAGTLCDYSVEDAASLSHLDGAELRAALGAVTRGHSSNPVL